MVFMGFIIPVAPAQALGVDTVVKLVAGKAIVRAVAEKAGMALSKKQLDNVAGVIEKKSFDGDSNAINFINGANNLVSSGASPKSGFKKYLLDPALWLTGLDLVVLAAGAFQSGYDNNTPVPVYGGCMPRAFDNITIPAGSSYARYYNNGMSRWELLIYKDTDFVYQGLTTTNLFVSKDSNGHPWDEYRRAGAGTTGDWVYAYTGNALSIGKPANFSSFQISTEETVCQESIDNTEIVNISNVDNTVLNYFNSPTYISNTTYIMEIDVPDIINYNDIDVWNLPDTNLPVELAPPPLDTDNDGIPDSTDITPNGDTGLPIDDVPKSLWDKLFPVLLIIKLFGLLGSALMYLVRMFQFIMTIPGIDAIPIDNAAFVWFRSTQIIGIKIYDVVSSLAGVGLSFIVFRAIRRAFL
jgi:hypothetical protein